MPLVGTQKSRGDIHPGSAILADAQYVITGSEEIDTGLRNVRSVVVGLGEPAAAGKAFVYAEILSDRPGFIRISVQQGDFSDSTTPCIVWYQASGNDLA